MNERDDELKNILRRWESPSPGAKLDARVWNSFRQYAPAPHRKWRTWLPVAAAVVLAVGIAHLWPEHRVTPPPIQHQGVSIATTMDATGFRPVSNGAITVVKAGKKQ